MRHHSLFIALVSFATFVSTGFGQDQKPEPGKEKAPVMKSALPQIDDKILDDPKTAQAAAAFLEAAYQGTQPPEGLRMLISILRGSRMGPGDGWFGPCETRYTWNWLAKIHGVDPDSGSIPKKMFLGNDELFARLDRDLNGRLTADDLDWSERGAIAQFSVFARNLFRKLNTDNNGQ